MKPLIAKISRPTLQSVCPRPRLFRRLDALARRHPIVWIAAPAGSGKTTLASSWLGVRRRRALWYQIDPRDADPAAFFYYLREAAARAAPRRRETLPLLGPEFALGLDIYARGFFEALGGRLPARCALVLDNYQDFPEEAPLHPLLAAALPALPEGVRVVVLSRAPPPPPYARLVAEGRIGFLGGQELNLTERETRALARSRRRPAGAADAAALLARSGGWMAATVLLLESSVRALPAPGEGADAAQQVLFDYFAAEVFDRAPEAIRRLLLEIALLPQPSAGEAAALSGEPRAGEILSELVRRGDFTNRLAGAEPRFRLHPLFREFLLARGRRTLAPERRADLARRAAGLLAGAGSPDEAAALLAEAGDHAGLAQLVVAHAPALARQGRFASIAAWLRLLPAAVVEGEPWLVYWLGVCSLASPPEARAKLEAAYRAFRARGDVTGALLAWSAFVSSFFFLWDTFQGLDPWIAEMEELRRTSPAFPSVEVEAQVTAGMFASLMWRAPAHPSVDHWTARATALLDSDASPELRMQLGAYLALYWTTWRGDNARTHEVLHRTRALVESPAVSPLTEILWTVMESHHRARLGDPAACLAAVEHGLATARRTGVMGMNGFLAIQGVWGALGAGDLAVARRYLALAEDWLAGSRAHGMHASHLRAWIELCAGDPTAAAAASERSEALLASSGALTVEAWDKLTRAHLLVERGEREEAVRLLEAAAAEARRLRDDAILHACLLSVAWARLSGGREAEAVAPLAEGLRLGRERGYRAHPWIGWRRDVMARLAAFALERGIEPEHVRETIRAGGLSPPEGAEPEGWPWPVRVRTLGTFEVHVGERKLSFAGKVPRKPLELLQALVALGGAEVREEALTDLLWPDAEGDAARRALDTTAYRLRKLLGADGALVQRERRLNLEPRICWADALVLQRRLARPAAALAGGADRAALAAEAERTLSLYRGPFLPALGEGLPWADAMRRRLRTQVARRLRAVAERLEHAGSAELAADVVRRGLDADPELPVERS